MRSHSSNYTNREGLKGEGEDLQGGLEGRGFVQLEHPRQDLELVPFHEIAMAMGHVRSLH